MVNFMHKNPHSFNNIVSLYAIMEDFEKEYGEQAIKNYVRAKVNKNKREGNNKKYMIITYIYKNA